MLKLVLRDGVVILPVKVVPGASRTKYLGEWQGRARIAVAAPPEKGKANAALVQFLAEALQIRVQNVSVVAGQSAPLKQVRISGVGVDAVRAMLK